jgi:hypothetical protein
MAKTRFFDPRRPSKYRKLPRFWTISPAFSTTVPDPEGSTSQPEQQPEENLGVFDDDEYNDDDGAAFPVIECPDDQNSDDESEEQDADSGIDDDVGAQMDQHTTK